MGDNILYGAAADGLIALDTAAGAQSFVDMLDGYPLGVYSALRTFGHNKFLDLEAHLARTTKSMALLGWSYQLDEGRFRQVLHEAVSSYPLADSRVRFDVLAEPVIRQGQSIRELIALRPFTPVPAEYYLQGVCVDIAPEVARNNPLAKTADFAHQREPLSLGRERDHYERLLIDHDNRLLEGMMTNFWAVRGGVVYTAGSGVLEGVTRKILLALIPQLDIPLRQEAVSRAEIGSLDEAALSGSSRALLPVVRINGQMVGDGWPGPISKRILAAYNDYVAKEIKTAVE